MQLYMHSIRVLMKHYQLGMYVWVCGRGCLGVGGWSVPCRIGASSTKDAEGWDMMSEMDVLIQDPLNSMRSFITKIW